MLYISWLFYDMTVCLVQIIRILEGVNREDFNRNLFGWSRISWFLINELVIGDLDLFKC